ncbi:hypothetical protein ABT304_05810 [Nocardioides sp. NPDC000445]|uniref:hypothetical protein n=1 Tax=Nocardioides sp. NPDC000445 TaxID=3154257 RepID=UPI00331A8757
MTKNGQTSVSEASASGDRGDILRALQERLARALDDPKTAAHALPPLAKRLLEVGDEIQAREAHGAGSVVSTAEDEPWDGSG